MRPPFFGLLSGRVSHRRGQSRGISFREADGGEDCVTLFAAAAPLLVDLGLADAVDGGSSSGITSADAAGLDAARAGVAASAWGSVARAAATGFAALGACPPGSAAAPPGIVSEAPALSE